MKAKLNRSMKYLVLISLIVIVASSVAGVKMVFASGPIAVDTNLDDFGSDLTLCSLREAIHAINMIDSFGGCSNADGLANTIIVPAGIYILTLTGSFENQNESGDLNVLNDMNIIGAGSASTVIDANFIDRVFSIIWDVNVSISNLTIRNGFTPQAGGGIYNNGQLTLSGVRIESNSSDYSGGGIYCNYYIGIDHPSLTIFNSTLYNNYANNVVASGGGIANNGGRLSLTGVTFESNHAQISGGGLWSISTYAAQLYRTRFINNGATQYSGGNIFNDGPMSIDQSIISGGNAGYEGGNIYSGEYGAGTPFLQITNSQISGGYAQNGGGISTDGELTVVNTTLFNNYATTWGGAALFAREATGQVILDHVTIADNHLLTGAFGSIYQYYSENPVVIHNSILDAGSEVVCAGVVSSTSSYNIDSGTTCGLLAEAGLHNQSSTDALLLANDNYGGFSQTMAIPHYSPAVDAADSVGCVMTDQRLVSRPIDGNGDGIKNCDIGAFELGSNIYIPMIIK